MLQTFRSHGHAPWAEVGLNAEVAFPGTDRSVIACVAANLAGNTRLLSWTCAAASGVEENRDHQEVTTVFVRRKYEGKLFHLFCQWYTLE